ncbi:MAG: magnesium transporter [Acholeplasmataceae bacterium]|jgi:magnesium transporter|nr:magnesium transporter [Acholeplasmataceae bacterium]MDD4194256.1 magnesium transporter [Acholeplasmataceae bacterium]MDY0338544.1 magnesium transporter [Acholeplasmataceae bacterium]
MLKELLNNQNEKHIKAFLDDLHAHDLSELFEELDDSEKDRLFSMLSDEKRADLVSYLEVDDAASLLSELNIDEQVALVEMMEPDDAVDIIQELEDEDQEELLARLGEDSEVSSLIHYDDDETGSAMTNQVIVVHPNMDVKDATKMVIKEAPEVETISTLFVTDDQHQFLGVVPLRKLLKAKTPCLVTELIQESPYVIDKDPITQSISAINNYTIYEMPVLNEKHELVGMITLDDALDIYQEEAQEDFEKLAALPDTDEEHHFVKAALHRVPWLIFLLALSIPISLVTSLFEHVLATVAILIIFQPLILDSAGNVATQTLAVTLKMLSTKEEGMLKNSVREILTGMINGLVIGLLAVVMTIIFAWINPSLSSNPYSVSLVVGLSLWLTIIISPVIAIMIPVTLDKLNVDPAIASGPFITTLIDVAALFIYFGLAVILLGGL